LLLVVETRSQLVSHGGLEMPALLTYLESFWVRTLRMLV
jgi:hypothetical protein